MKAFKLLRNKTGQVFSQLSAMGVGIATLVIVFAVIFLIGANVRAQIAVVDAGTNSTAFNATETLIEAAATVPGWVGLVVLVGIGAILLGLIALFRNN